MVLRCLRQAHRFYTYACPLDAAFRRCVASKWITFAIAVVARFATEIIVITSSSSSTGRRSHSSTSIFIIINNSDLINKSTCQPLYQLGADVGPGSGLQRLEEGL